METKDYFEPETVKDVVAAWDSGRPFFTVEMGGIGPGYEQCIQILAFELLRDHLGDEPLPEDGDGAAWQEWGRATVHRLNYLGFSGAQVGAAKSLAAQAIAKGWRAAIKSVPKDRRILVSKEFPQLRHE